VERELATLYTGKRGRERSHSKVPNWGKAGRKNYSASMSVIWVGEGEGIKKKL